MGVWNVGHEPLIRIRRADAGLGDDGWGADGRWIGPGETETEFEGTIDPVPDEMTDLLPVGTMRKDAIFLLTWQTDLRTDDDDVQPQVFADYILRGGKRYKIVYVQVFPRLIVHWEALAVRVKDHGPGSLDAPLDMEMA